MFPGDRRTANDLVKDIDSGEFREQSVSRLQAELTSRLDALKVLLHAGNFNELENFTLKSTYALNRTVVGANEQDDISSTSDTAIIHSLGMTIWRRPDDPGILEVENITALGESLKGQKIDLVRFAKGVYFLEVLTHKFRDGNGRVARGMKLLFDKLAQNAEITEGDARKVLGIGKEILTQTGQHTFKINFNPDFKHLVLGVAYFGLHKDLTEPQVNGELGLNGTMPEKGLEALAQKFGVSKDQLKKEFVRFIAVDSNLEWCDFKD